MRKSIFASLLFVFGALGLIKLEGNLMNVSAENEKATELDTDDHGNGCCCSSCGTHIEHQE